MLESDASTTEQAVDKYFAHDHITVIEPGRGWRNLDLKELWAYRELLWVLAARDIKVRYKQTVLGIAWAVLQPVLTMVVFSVIFGRLANIPSDGYPYPIFVYAALLPWMFFAGAVASAASSVVGSANLVTKIYFPRLIIPLSSIGSGLLDFVLASIVLLVLMYVYDVAWTVNLLAVPLLVLMLCIVSLGIGTWLAALNVAYRDFRYVVPFMLQLWMFATPVVYPATLVPERFHWLLFLNPMAGIVDGFRAAFLGAPFNSTGLFASLAIGLSVFFAGAMYFAKVERRFADVI